MRLHRFHVSSQITDETFDITDRDMVHQWRTVFRYNVGSQVVLFDGTGTDYVCMITSLRNLGATVSVVEKNEDITVPKRKLWLCMGLIKKDNFELVAQKATELGVSDIVPVLCERSEKKNINMERLQKISIEASEQSGRRDIPAIHEVADLSEALQAPSLPTYKVALNLEGESLLDVIKHEEFNDLAIFIGPEGGWSDRELKLFSEHNIPSVSLGAQVLRAETAAIAACSLLLL